MKIFYSFIILNLIISCNKLNTKQNYISKKELPKQEKKVKKSTPIKVSYWTDKEYKVSNIDSIFVSLQVGFDKITSFNFFINDSLFGKISCKTNGSIGRCIKNSKELEIPEIYINNKFKSGDSLKIITDKEIIKLELKEMMKQYNELDISKYDDYWFLGFENSNRPYTLE